MFNFGAVRRLHPENSARCHCLLACGCRLARNLLERDAPGELERQFGTLLDRLLLDESIFLLDAACPDIVLRACAKALTDAFASRTRNAGGDYAPAPRAERFPVFTRPGRSSRKPHQAGKVTLIV